MRYVTSIPTTRISADTSLVQGLTASHAVKPVQARDPLRPNINRSTTEQVALHSNEYRKPRNVPTEDRRKTCRRISHLPVLIELRSGVERRRHNLRGNDLVEHIDEEA